MSVISKKTVPFPRAKIERIVRGILPKGKKLELKTTDSGIGGKKVVRFITRAWEDERNPERIGRVLDALDGQLSEAQRKAIFRVSVLTPEEYERVVLDSPARFVRLAKAASRKKAAAKRKAVRKPKRGSAS